MNVTKLLDNIQSMYGDYKPGMLISIENELMTCSESKLDKLWSEIKKYHSKSFPPTWWELQRIAERSRIDILKIDYEFVYVCGNCLSEYPIEQGICKNPKCETRGMSLPLFCPFCFLKETKTEFDDSDGVKTKCLVCGNIRTYAFIKRYQ